MIQGIDTSQGLLHDPIILLLDDSYFVDKVSHHLEYNVLYLSVIKHSQTEWINNSKSAVAYIRPTTIP